jgi:flagellar hook-associated protein 3 FlgL
VAQLRQALVGIANTRGSAGYLFAGTDVEAPPFDAAGVFGGNDAAIPVEVADGLLVRSNASGALAFTSLGGRDIFAELQGLETSLASDDSAGIQGAIAAMSESHGQVVRARAEAGLTMDRLRMSVEVAETASNALSRVKASEAEADLATAYSELSSATSAYERMLEIARRTLQGVDLSRFP